ncbi:hypothetical protein IWW55_005764 [Coemansia sp. RSA 2706]|nr:hypothetical protein IWW55_005764 [Coemansia sp. RSA 2706]KAJ2302268.1 hypothetical protein IWW54_006088 [Coemansia sp. RSA 2705]KAJ2359569.1 hypothetical protein H4S01_006107 [Coemansia sp. RSA 2610]KAJ2366566.1 hypothetical protein H4S02_010448 [Coemansia sp. RSA 2611]
MMGMDHSGLSPASSIDANIRTAPQSRSRQMTFGSTGRHSSQTSHRSRSNSEAQGRLTHRTHHADTIAEIRSSRDSSSRRGRLPEIPPILPVNSTTGEELGIGVGAGIASHVPRKIEDVLFPDSPTPPSPRLHSSSGAASRVKSWFNRRTSRWGVPGLDQPLTISSVLSERREQPEILQQMRVHRGVIDPDALSELPPDVLFSRVLQTLDDLGFTVLKTEGLKIRVLRPRRQDPMQCGRIRTMSTNVESPDPSFDVHEGPRRQSVPTVHSSPSEKRAMAVAAKRATIMNPARPDHEPQQAFTLSDKHHRRPRTLGSALTSVRRFFGGNNHGLAPKRWFGVTWPSGKDADVDSASTAIESGERPGYTRRGSATTQGLGIAASADSPHRRSMSESPYLNAKAIRDQANPGSGLEAVPEEGEAAAATAAAATTGRAGGAAEAQPPNSAKSAVTSDGNDLPSGGITPLPHSVDIPSPFNSTPLVSGTNLAEHPFINPFQKGVAPPYGTPQVDNGDEVQLAIEVCKIKNLNNFFIVHLSRRKGNAWAYKHLYHLIMERLALRSEDARRYAPRA